jgi:hypothetical protein
VTEKVPQSFVRTAQGVGLGVLDLEGGHTRVLSQCDRSDADDCSLGFSGCVARAGSRVSCHDHYVLRSLPYSIACSIE